MKRNRSIPTPPVVPVLIYPDVRQAVAWLEEVFGFAERLQIGEAHRSQMTYRDGQQDEAEAARRQAELVAHLRDARREAGEREPGDHEDGEDGPGRAAEVRLRHPTAA